MKWTVVRPLSSEMNYKEEDSVMRELSYMANGRMSFHRICDNCICHRLRLPVVVIYFEYNNSEGANAMGTPFNRIIEQNGLFWQWHLLTFIPPPVQVF